jgi:hypothetical protein
VLSQGDNDGFRATQMIQDKAQPAENGMPFSRAATLDWIIWVAPFGRVGKRLIARRLKRLLSVHLLTRTVPLPASLSRLKRLLLVRSTASRLAETIIITLREHPHAAL